ncbi:MAG: sulfite oxidase heme-binding subunit YedZ [Moraxellaceae bacterium]
MVARVDAVAWSKVVLWLMLLWPAGSLLLAGVQDRLGPDPAKALVDATGLWALRCLLLSLCMTPLRRWTGHSVWLRYRRLLGLFALFYACLHVVAYVFLLFGAQWQELGRELLHRPYVMVGAAAFLILLLMGLTSTRGWQRRLARRWGQLHRLVYAALPLVLVHYFWVQKLGWQVVWPYAMAAALLLGIRLWWKIRQSRTGRVKSR